MAPKRKSDAFDEEVAVVQDHVDQENLAPVFKKARVSDAPEASTSKGKKGKEPSKPKDWSEIVLEGEEDEGVPVYDDCNEIRRKIRLLQKEPTFKVSQWLKDIGNVNSNSYGRFMKASGATGGAGNGTYYSAYVYFEKVRIAQGKKKTPKRERNEIEHPGGFELRDRKGMWVYTGR